MLPDGWNVYGFTTGNNSVWDTHWKAARSETEALLRLRLEGKAFGRVKNRFNPKDGFDDSVLFTPVEKLDPALLAMAQEKLPV